mgnify:CR=1 FL=1
MATRIVFDLGEGKVRISPKIWPDHKLDIQPGDLSQSPPNGNGVYGYQNRSGENPIKNAPSQEPSGGVIYFDNNITKEDFTAFLRIMDIKGAYGNGSANNEYAVFAAESDNPGKDKYLTQIRIVSKFGLRFMFGALTDAEYDKFPEQGMNVVDALWTFIEHEKKRWGTSFTQDGKNGLRGLFGGDGDFAREELAFGFMVENQYHNVCRIWSRAWLVTK